MALLSQRFDWRGALVIVQPQTVIRWHRQCFRTLWGKKSLAGRPSIPTELQSLIRRMANENITWGEERIANELWVKHSAAINATKCWDARSMWNNLVTALPSSRR